LSLSLSLSLSLLRLFLLVLRLITSGRCPPYLYPWAPLHSRFFGFLIHRKPGCRHSSAADADSRCCPPPLSPHFLFISIFFLFASLLPSILKFFCNRGHDPRFSFPVSFPIPIRGVSNEELEFKKLISSLHWPSLQPRFSLFSWPLFSFKETLKSGLNTLVSSLQANPC